MNGAPVWSSLGARVEVDAALPDSLDRALRDYWQEDAAGSKEGRTVRWQVGTLPPLPSAAQSQRLRLVEGEWEVWVLGDEVWLPDRLHLALTGADAAITLSAQAAAEPFALLEVFSLVMTEIHRAAGWLPLHAAVIGRGGRAVALSGVSGAGKSTATLRLRGAGYDVLAEDRAFWRAEAGEVAGLDRHLRAFDDSLERFAPQLVSQSVGRDVKGKHLLPLARAGRARLSRVLLFGDETPLSSTERVKAVWEMTGVPLTARAKVEVQRAVGQLLPLLSPQPVQRDTVLARVSQELEGQLPEGQPPEDGSAAG